MLLRLWYPVTVATISWHIKQTIRQFLERTSDDPVEQLRFKLHDFGARGVSSAESAALGGSAHLVNFAGTDNVLALLAVRAHYHEAMAGFSIPAAEHSTITSWGRENEVEAYRNMLRQFAKPGAVVAVVSDSYDIYHAIREHWGKTLKDEVIKSGATLVVRPDSGDPVQVVHQCLALLDDAFGHTMTSKGYKVLKHVRVIQGDGINPNSIRAILERATSAGYATDNLTFGMGGGLLQQLHRDTQKFALKCSAARINGRWIDVYKEPITDKGKISKRGRMTLLQHRDVGTFQTVPVPPEATSLADVVKPPGYEDAMLTVWENGNLVRDWTLLKCAAAQTPRGSRLSPVPDRFPPLQLLCDQLGALLVVAAVQDRQVLGIGAQVNSRCPCAAARKKCSPVTGCTIRGLDPDLTGPIHLRRVGVSGPFASPIIEDAGRILRVLCCLAPVPRRQSSVRLP